MWFSFLRISIISPSFSRLLLFEGGKAIILTESFKRYVKLLDTQSFYLTISGDMLTIKFPKELNSIHCHEILVNKEQVESVKKLFSESKGLLKYQQVLEAIDINRDFGTLMDCDMTGLFSEYPCERRGVFLKTEFTINQANYIATDNIISEGFSTYTFDGKSTNFISEYLTEKGFTEDSHAPNWWVSGQEGREGWFYLVKIFFSDLLNKHSFTLATVYPDGKKYFMIHRFYVESIEDLDFLFNNQHDLRFHKPIKVESHTWHKIV